MAGSLAGGIALGALLAPNVSSAAQVSGQRSSDLPANITPTAYANRSSGYGPFAATDYYSFADDLGDRAEPFRQALPRQSAGGGSGAFRRHSTLFASGTVAKLIDEGYTGLPDPHFQRRVLGHNARPRRRAKRRRIFRRSLKALGCKKAYSFYYRNHRMDDCAIIEIRSRLIFLFRLSR